MRLILMVLALSSGPLAHAAATVAQLREGYIAYSPRRGLVAMLVDEDSCCVDVTSATLQIRRVGETKVLRSLRAGCFGSDCIGGERLEPRGPADEHEANRILAELGFELPRDALVCRDDCTGLAPALLAYGITLDGEGLHHDAQTFKRGSARQPTTIYVPSIGLVAGAESVDDPDFPDPPTDRPKLNHWWTIDYVR